MPTYERPEDLGPIIELTAETSGTRRTTRQLPKEGIPTERADNPYPHDEAVDICCCGDCVATKARKYGLDYAGAAMAIEMGLI